MSKYRLRSRLTHAMQGALRYYRSEYITPSEWEQSYAQGTWKRLETMTEVSHYSAIVGYCDILGKKRILDVGCGHGVLADRLKHLPYIKYCGFDVSSAAINEAKATHSDVRNEFQTSQVDIFESSDNFDVIVFNEVLYYLDDPIRAVKRCQTFLSDNGHILISMYKSGRSTAAWALLDSVLKTIDATTITHMSGASWVIKISTPKPL
jgi:2-polyprenyl-6-hydroxyphenyl methylase/3-demethylubiquinone-9 3-methyltransferase